MARLNIQSSCGFSVLIFAILVQDLSATEFPKSCSEIQSGSNSSALENHLIYPNGPDGESLEVLCDFNVENDGSGWTVIQKRSSGPRDEFERDWNEYVQGFGSPSGNLWLGLENIRALTKNGHQELRVELEDFEGEKAYAEYTDFSISDASDFYRLRISGFSGDAGDSLISSNGYKFSTRDKDNDNFYDGNCATERGAWWFNVCSYAWLNGRYQEKGEGGAGILWFLWRGSESLAKTEMKIRTRTSKSGFEST